jgi:hypothetical protein
VARDLNIMVRRGVVRAEARQLAAPVTLVPRLGRLFVLAKQPLRLNGFALGTPRRRARRAGSTAHR